MKTKLLLSTLAVCLLYLTANSTNTGSVNFSRAKNNGIRIPHQSANALTTQGTVEAWVMLNPYAAFGGIIHKGDRKTWVDEAYSLQLWNDNKVYFYLVNGSNSKYVASTTVLESNVWYHIAACWNSSGMAIYVNGVLEGSSSQTLTLSYSNTSDTTYNGLHIGEQLNEDYDATYKRISFDGKIDEARIWNTRLSAYQIQKRMFTELNSSDSLWNNLVGYYPLNEATGTTTDDASTNSNSGRFFPTGSNTPVWDASVFPEYIEWTGSTSSDMVVKTNYNQKIKPNAFAQVRIPNNPTRYPQITNNTNCGELRIAAGSGLRVESSKTLKVWGDLILESNDSCVGSVVNLGTLTITGDIIIDRKVISDGWHYVSSPVQNASSNYFYGSALYSYNETTATWSKIQAGQTLTTMKGYDAYFKNSHKVVRMNGTPNSGNISMNLSYTSDGYNLVGNPYPAVIDWAASSGWTKTRLNGAVYIWDPARNNFSTYSGGVGLNGGSRYISPTQGFFVKATRTGAKLSMTPSVCVYNVTQAFREESKEDILMFKISNGKFYDETAVRFSNNASPLFDDELDAYKLFSYDISVPQIYTSSSEDIQYSINSLPISNKPVTIPLGIRINQNGEHSVNYDLRNFSKTAQIYIEDLKENKMIDLKTGKYSFYGKVEDDPDRFLIHIVQTQTIASNETTSGLNETDSDIKVPVFCSDHKIYIDARLLNNAKYNFRIINVLGSTIYTSQLENANINIIDFPHEEGYYIIQINSDDQNASFKVFLN